MDCLISVEKLVRDFGQHRAVDNVSFSAQQGEILGLLGPNGAGKSTTMQIVCGVMAATSGTVSIAGISLIDEPKQAKRHIGFLPERPPLYIDLNVDEFLRYAASLRGVSKKNIKNAVDTSKQQCGLTEVGKRLIGNLSKGYQQRVGIAQAIIHDPILIILDEPTSGLDPNQILEIRNLICELGDQHSVILSSHILSEVQSVCERVLIINEGSIVMDEQLNNLMKPKQTVVFRVALRRAPTMEILQNVDGVINVQPIDAHRFKIFCNDDVQVIDQLTQLAVANNWGLFELFPERHSLEEAFVQLTQSQSI